MMIIPPELKQQQQRICHINDEIRKIGVMCIKILQNVFHYMTPDRRVVPSLLTSMLPEIEKEGITITCNTQ